MASKELERMFLDGWLKDHPELTFVRNSERPDFIVQDDVGELGVEVRQVFRDKGRKGSPKRIKESSRGKFLRKLASAYYTAGGRPISLSSLMSIVPSNEAIDRIVAKLRAERPAELWEQERIPDLELAFRRFSA